MPLLEELYRRGGVELTPKVRERFQQYLDGNPRGKHGRIRYDLQRHFGISADELRERFDFYFDRFDVRPETEREHRAMSQATVRTGLSQPAGRRRDAPGGCRTGRADRPGAVVLAGSVERLPADHRRRPGDRQHRHGLRGSGAPRQLRRRRLLAGALHHLHPGPRGPCRRPGQRARPRYNRCRTSELDALARRQRTPDPISRQPQRIRLQRHPGDRHPGHPTASRYQAPARPERSRPSTSTSRTRSPSTLAGDGWS